MRKENIIYLIYKAFMDKNGEYLKVDLIETDKNDKAIYSFTKLYNLQVPLDMRHKIQYNQLTVQIMDEKSEKSKDWF